MRRCWRGGGRSEEVQDVKEKRYSGRVFVGDGLSLNLDPQPAREKRVPWRARDDRFSCCCGGALQGDVEN